MLNTIFNAPNMITAVTIAASLARPDLTLKYGIALAIPTLLEGFLSGKNYAQGNSRESFFNFAFGTAAGIACFGAISVPVILVGIAATVGNVCYKTMVNDNQGLPPGYNQEMHVGN